MHYTSWDRSKHSADPQQLDLLAEDGPDVIAEFYPEEERAVINYSLGERLLKGESARAETDGGVAKDSDEVWPAELYQSKDGEEAVSMTVNDLHTYRLVGRLSKDKRMLAELHDKTFVLVNENANNWVIEDEGGEKVGQFSGLGSGVRKAILEFEGNRAEEMCISEVVALSWFVRLILEERVTRSSTMLIIFLVFLTLVVVATVLFYVA